MRELELLAPARNADIGIAAIDCGADAVYIAGPSYGARQNAGNPMEEVRRLCEYAHRFGARVFLTLNTILYDSELKEALDILSQAREAGVDALLAQDLAVFEALRTLRQAQGPQGPEVHASTQCAIRTPEQARFYESLGASRLVLERQLSLEQIKVIRAAVDCELEFFVHGALCVCYSGQCYLSEAVEGRSANRGCCIQACRSLYDLVDGNGKTLVKDKALLSLKDYNLIGRLEDLASAGICSFKIEGRLKGISYVRNVVRAYSAALDSLVGKYPELYRRSSFGKVEGGFVPDLGKAFNRGYTELFLDGKKGKWSSMDAPKSIGEPIGTVIRITCGDPRAKGLVAPKPAGRMQVLLKLHKPFRQLRNGDGFSFISKDHNGIVGFRGDVCRGAMINARAVPELYEGAELYRNMDTAFEKEMEANLPVRRIPVDVFISVSASAASADALCQGQMPPSSAAPGDLRFAPYPGKGSPGADLPASYRIVARAESQDGRVVTMDFEAGSEMAENRQRMAALFESQIGKATGIYSFRLKGLDVQTAGGVLPLMPSSAINAIRREIADRLTLRQAQGPEDTVAEPVEAHRPVEGPVTYKSNVANKVAREVLERLGASSVEEAFELSHKKGAELMRSKYCIRHELGLCPLRQAQGPSGPKDLYLVNNGRRYRLGFDCAACEMTVSYSE